MRLALISLVMIPLVVGCGGGDEEKHTSDWGSGYEGLDTATDAVGDTGDADDVEEAGVLRVTPETLDFGTIATTSTGKVAYFAVINDGTANLLVKSVTITDSGENTGFEVFSNLRRADSGEGTEFTLGPNEKKEFSVVAMRSEPMEAEGNIEISTDDTTIDDEGIGKYQLKLFVKVVSPL